MSVQCTRGCAVHLGDFSTPRECSVHLGNVQYALGMFSTPGECSVHLWECSVHLGNTIEYTGGYYSGSPYVQCRLRHTQSID